MSHYIGDNSGGRTVTWTFWTGKYPILYLTNIVISKLPECFKNISVYGDIKWEKPDRIRPNVLHQNCLCKSVCCFPSYSLLDENLPLQRKRENLRIHAVYLIEITTEPNADLYFDQRADPCHYYSYIYLKNRQLLKPVLNSMGLKNISLLLPLFWRKSVASKLRS